MRRGDAFVTEETTGIKPLCAHESPHGLGEEHAWPCCVVGCEHADPTRFAFGDASPESSGWASKSIIMFEEETGTR
jgi:hypothetical protein